MSQALGSQNFGSHGTCYGRMVAVIFSSQGRPPKLHNGKCQHILPCGLELQQNGGGGLRKHGILIHSKYRNYHHRIVSTMWMMPRSGGNIIHSIASILRIEKAYNAKIEQIPPYGFQLQQYGGRGLQKKSKPPLSPLRSIATENKSFSTTHRTIRATMLQKGRGLRKTIPHCLPLPMYYNNHHKSGSITYKIPRIRSNCVHSI